MVKKMISDIEKILARLNLKATGYYDDQFYIIPIKDSDEYAKMYTLLDENAINTEYPNFGINTNKSTVNITNYFEIEEDSITYNLFLIANFKDDKYYLRIGEKA